jgi:hypothetical protein
MIGLKRINRQIRIVKIYFKDVNDIRNGAFLDHGVAESLGDKLGFLQVFCSATTEDKQRW